MTEEELDAQFTSNAEAPLKLGGVELGADKDLRALYDSMTDEQKEEALQDYMKLIDSGEEESEDVLADDESDKPTTLEFKEPSYPFAFQGDHIERIYPFDMKLETRIITNEEDENFGMKDSDMPPYWSKLHVYRRRLQPFMSRLQMEVFQELAGARFKASEATVCFTSRALPSQQANENRVFQYFDALLWESKRLAEEFEKEDTADQLAAEAYLAAKPKSFSRFNPQAKVPKLVAAEEAVAEEKRRKLAAERAAAIAEEERLMGL